MTRSCKKVYQIVLEIIFLIIFLFVSYRMWNNNHMESYSKIAESYANYNAVDYYVEGNWNKEGLMPITDSEAKEKEHGVLKIRSIRNTTNATLALQVAKTSSLNFQELNLLFDNEVIKLKNCELFEDSDYYYVTVYRGEVTTEVSNHNIYLYLDASVGNETQNKEIAIDIVAIEDEIVM